MRAFIRARTHRTATEWRQLAALQVAGVPLLARHFRTMAAIGVSQVVLDPALQDLPGPDSPLVAFADARQSAPAAGDLEVDAELVVDVRALQALVALGRDSETPIEVVDDFHGAPPESAKSPWTAGVPTSGELRLVEFDPARHHPVGARLVGSDALSPRHAHVGRLAWACVDSPRAARAATRLLLLGTMKPGDGLYSRFNRRLSMRLSGALLGTRLTPNAATLINMAMSVTAGVLMATGASRWLVAGAVLALVSSLFDGVDGELARARLETSDTGRWLDTAEGSVFYIAVVAGLGTGVCSQLPSSNPCALTAAATASMVGWSIVNTWLTWQYARVRSLSGLGGQVSRAMHEDSAAPVRWFLRTCSFVAKRAACGWYIALFAIAGWQVAAWRIVATTALLSFPLSIYVARMVLREAGRPAASIDRAGAGTLGRQNT